MFNAGDANLDPRLRGQYARMPPPTPPVGRIDVLVHRNLGQANIDPRLRGQHVPLHPPIPPVGRVDLPQYLTMQLQHLGAVQGPPMPHIGGHATPTDSNALARSLLTDPSGYRLNKQELERLTSRPRSRYAGSPPLSNHPGSPPPDGSMLAEHDRQQKASNKSPVPTTTSIARPTSTPLPGPASASALPPSTLAAKRGLELSPDHYAQGPPPKRALLASPSFLQQRSKSENNIPPAAIKERRLSQEAARHGVHNLDLSTFKGIAKQADAFDLPGHANTAGLTPGYANKLLEARNAAASPSRRAQPPMQDNTRMHPYSRGDQMLQNDMMRRKAAEASYKALQAKQARHLQEQQRLEAGYVYAIGRGVRMDQVEIGGMAGVIKRLMDSYTTPEYRYGHLKTGRERRSAGGGGEGRIPMLGQMSVDGEAPPSILRDNVEQEKESIFSPLNPQTWQRPIREEDGGLRAPEPLFLTETATEVLWLEKWSRLQRKAEIEKERSIEVA